VLLDVSLSLPNPRPFDAKYGVKSSLLAPSNKFRAKTNATMAQNEKAKIPLTLPAKTIKITIPTVTDHCIALPKLNAADHPLTC
jgi:hypothetical protein